MEIPEFDPDRWALVFFRQIRTPHCNLRFPHSPQEVLLHQTPLVLARSCNGVFDTLEWPIDGMPAINEALAALQEHPWVTSASLYSIHSNNLLGRFWHWAALQGVTRGQFHAVNLVERFHGPAVLTLPDRQEFSAQEVRTFAGIEVDPASASDTETSTLLQLCHKLR